MPKYDSAPTMLSLFDLSGVMAEPWKAAGYATICVDIQRDGTDVRHWIPPMRNYVFVAAFPPCTDVAVSGARWFRDKGLGGLAAAIELFERARDICEWSGAPWFIENPVSTLSTYWRPPDHTFSPHDYALSESDNYTKKTCLWTGGGFVMPSPSRLTSLPPPDDRIHKMPPSADRANQRSITPAGFAMAVYLANADR